MPNPRSPRNVENCLFLHHEVTSHLLTEACAVALPAVIWDRPVAMWRPRDCSVIMSVLSQSCLSQHFQYLKI
jgi:hypothetical protein